MVSLSLTSMPSTRAVSPAAMATSDSLSPSIWRPYTSSQPGLTMILPSVLNFSPSTVVIRVVSSNSACGKNTAMKRRATMS